MLTRFAPSPTGYLHIGNARTALICYLYAKKQGGKFMLRVDDTDAERSRPEYTEAIKEDLSWLGISWDTCAHQSERLENYEAAKQKLIESGRLYPCYESQEELEIKRKMQMGRGLPPIYDRAALKLTEEDKAKLEAEGRKPHYRFKLEDAEIRWNDEVRGETSFHGSKLSDPILIRENGMFTYMLPSTVDDIDFGVTHVVRGEDHVSNTAIQIQLFEAMGGTVPTFAHMALIKAKEGKMSKREGGYEIRNLREQGIEPMALNSFLAKVGTSDAIEAFTDMEALIESFDISKLGRSSANYDPKEIERLNAKIVHELPYEAVKERLYKMVYPDKTNLEFWLAVRPNLNSVKEFGEWHTICLEGIGGREAVEPADIDFVKHSADYFPEGEVTELTWDEWVNALKNNTDRKGKALFMPLRLALTGKNHGPELKDLLPLLGREKVLRRLRGEESA